jgi:hypothetical protein
MATLLVLIGAAFLWKRRRSRTDHDVSDRESRCSRPADLRLAKFLCVVIAVSSYNDLRRSR